MSSIEPNFESEQPLVDKKMLNGSGDGSNATNGYNHRSGNVTGDVAPQNLKNHQLEANYRNQQQMLEAKLAKLQIRFYVLGGITILGFIILIILTAVFFTLLHSDIAHHTHKPKLGTQMAVILEEGVCVACEDYRLGASAEEEATLDKFIDESTEGSGLIKCCVDTPGELLELLKLFIERRFRLELSKGTVGAHWSDGSKDVAKIGVKPAAHLMFNRESVSNVKHIRGRQQVIKNWFHEGDMAFLAGGVEYDSGRIVIPTDGYYYVYSQITFLEYFAGDSGSHRSNQSPSLSAYLYRYNILYDRDGDELLAQNSITKYPGQSKSYREYTSTLGAVFNLRRQDHIFIKVTNVTMIPPEPKSSYFGVFKI